MTTEPSCACFDSHNSLLVPRLSITRGRKIVPDIKRTCMLYFPPPRYSEPGYESILLLPDTFSMTSHSRDSWKHSVYVVSIFLPIYLYSLRIQGEGVQSTENNIGQVVFFTAAMTDRPHCVGDIPDNVVCCHCNGVLQEPVQTVEGVRLCKKCFEAIIR